MNTVTHKNKGESIRCVIY